MIVFDNVTLTRGGATVLSHVSLRLTERRIGIVGASLATIVAIELNAHYGLIGVGAYLAFNGVLSLLALISIHETKDESLLEDPVA